MIIRKLFKFEGAHIVRNCSSVRCKKSLHGHSYIVEVFLTADKFDNGYMILDFGLLKGPIKDFLDSFDHAYSLWCRESEEFKKCIFDNSSRWVMLPLSPSAESYALMFFFVITKILQVTKFSNGEGNIKVSSVRVHETATGYAEAFEEDLNLCSFNLEDIVFSDDIKGEWSDRDMYTKLIQATESNSFAFYNPVVDQQVNQVIY